MSSMFSLINKLTNQRTGRMNRKTKYISAIKWIYDWLTIFLCMYSMCIFMFFYTPTNRDVRRPWNAPLCSFALFRHRGVLCVCVCFCSFFFFGMPQKGLPRYSTLTQYPKPNREKVTKLLLQIPVELPTKTIETSQFSLGWKHPNFLPSQFSPDHQLHRGRPPRTWLRDSVEGGKFSGKWWYLERKTHLKHPRFRSSDFPLSMGFASQRWIHQREIFVSKTRFSFKPSIFHAPC